MTDLYRDLGVTPAINAAGTLTRLSGTLMDPEVTAAMAEAARQFVRIDQLQAAVGKRIADVTGSEAALVTSGAAAAVTLATAACLARLDRAKMDRLPQTDGMPHEIVIARSQRNGYDHAFRAAGARLVEVGLAERTRDPQPWEIEAALSPESVAVAYIDGFSSLSLDDVVRVAHRYRLPVIVDAAASLPPKSNLSRFHEAGADLVCFSGGKGIRGPQASGILCGRKELIASAALQMWDLDNLPELWDPPPDLIEPHYAAEGVPNHGIGRGFKVGKEEIVGLWVALERFLQQDEAALIERLTGYARRLLAELSDLAGLRVELISSDETWPTVRIHVDPVQLGLSAIELARKLSQARQPIYVVQAEAKEQRLGIDPFGLRSEDLETIVSTFREILR